MIGAVLLTIALLGMIALALWWNSRHSGSVREHRSLTASPECQVKGCRAEAVAYDPDRNRWMCTMHARRAVHRATHTQTRAHAQQRSHIPQRPKSPQSPPRSLPRRVRGGGQ